MRLYAKSLIYVSPFWIILVLLSWLQDPLGILVFFAIPGVLVSIVLSGNIHDYSWMVATIANFIIYYFAVLFVLYIRQIIVNSRTESTSGFANTPGKL